MFVFFILTISTQTLSFAILKLTLKFDLKSVFPILAWNLAMKSFRTGLSLNGVIVFWWILKTIYSYPEVEIHNNKNLQKFIGFDNLVYIPELGIAP